MKKNVEATRTNARAGDPTRTPVRGNAVARVLGALACPVALSLALCAPLALAGDATSGTQPASTDAPAAASATAAKDSPVEVAIPALPSSGVAEDNLSSWWNPGRDTSFRGAALYARDDGGTRLISPYFTVDIPAEAGFDTLSFSYIDTYTITASASDMPSDDSTEWRWFGQMLTVTGDPSSYADIMVYLNRLGENSHEPIDLFPGQCSLDLGEAAVGDGWHVIVSTFANPSAEGSWEEAEQRLDEVAGWVSLSGMSSEPPVVPDDIKPVVGG